MRCRRFILAHFSPIQNTSTQDQTDTRLIGDKRMFELGTYPATTVTQSMSPQSNSIRLPMFIYTQRYRVMVTALIEARGLVLLLSCHRVLRNHVLLSSSVNYGTAK